MRIYYKGMIINFYLLIFISFIFACTKKETLSELIPDPCDTIVCQNGGTCVDGSCQCLLGFAGQFCEQIVDLCENVTCQNGGTCDNGKCDCPEGTYGTNCQITSKNPLGLQFKTEFGTDTTLMVITDGIFAIWWSPDFDHVNDVETMFTYLKQVQDDCLNKYGMADPPNPAARYFYNVYIHHGKDETILPTYWGNGQGTDKFGMPFLTLPAGAHTDFANLSHEGFHIFQYNANSPGFAYSGDSQWYIEASAQWYMAQNVPNEENTFIEAGTISSNPQLALWHSFENEAPGDPKDWLYQVRQYGMHLLLYYLTENESVDRQLIVNGFYANTNLSPQEYLYTNIGADNFRKYFANWSAHNTAGFDYIAGHQLDRAIVELGLAGDANNMYPYVHELGNSEASGTFKPADALKPRGWSYNVIKINNSDNTTYSFTLTGNAKGSEGGDAHFEARIIVKQSDGKIRYIEVPMSNALTGTISVPITSNDREIYVNVIAAPEHFSGNQTYDYEVVISKN